MGTSRTVCFGLLVARTRNQAQFILVAVHVALELASEQRALLCGVRTLI